MEYFPLFPFVSSLVLALFHKRIPMHPEALEKQRQRRAQLSPEKKEAIRAANTAAKKRRRAALSAEEQADERQRNKESKRRSYDRLYTISFEEQMGKTTQQFQEGLFTHLGSFQVGFKTVRATINVDGTITNCTCQACKAQHATQASATTGHSSYSALPSSAAAAAAGGQNNNPQATTSAASSADPNALSLPEWIQHHARCDMQRDSWSLKHAPFIIDTNPDNYGRWALFRFLHATAVATAAEHDDAKDVVLQR